MTLTQQYKNKSKIYLNFCTFIQMEINLLIVLPLFLAMRKKTKKKLNNSHANDLKIIE